MKSYEYLQKKNSPFGQLFLLLGFMSIETCHKLTVAVFFEAYKNFLDVLQKVTSNWKYDIESTLCFLNLKIYLKLFISSELWSCQNQL